MSTFFSDMKGQHPQATFCTCCVNLLKTFVNDNKNLFSWSFRPKNKRFTQKKKEKVHQCRREIEISSAHNLEVRFVTIKTWLECGLFWFLAVGKYAVRLVLLNASSYFEKTRS